MNLLNINSNQFEKLFDIAQINEINEITKTKQTKYVITHKEKENEIITFVLGPLFVDNVEIFQNKEKNKKIKIIGFTDNVINENNNMDIFLNKNKLIFNKILELEKWYVGKIWDKDFPIWKEQQLAITQEIVEEIETIEPSGISKAEFQEQRRRRFVNRAYKNIQKKRTASITNEDNPKTFLQLEIKKGLSLDKKTDDETEEKMTNTPENLKKGDSVFIEFQCENMEDNQNMTNFGMLLNPCIIRVDNHDNNNNSINDNTTKESKNNKRKNQIIEEDNKENKDDEDIMILSNKKMKEYVKKNEENIINFMITNFNKLEENINQIHSKIDLFQKENINLKTKFSKIKNVMETE